MTGRPRGSAGNSGVARWPIVTFQREGGKRHKATGFLLRDELLLTAGHVANGFRYRVESNNQEYPDVEVLWHRWNEENVDLALLRVPNLHLPPMTEPIEPLIVNRDSPVLMLDVVGWGYPEYVGKSHAVPLRGRFSPAAGSAPRVGARPGMATLRVEDSGPLVQAWDSPGRLWSGVSGGGLLTERNGKWWCVGVVSAHLETESPGILRIAQFDAVDPETSPLPDADALAFWQALGREPQWLAALPDEIDEFALGDAEIEGPELSPDPPVDCSWATWIDPRWDARGGEPLPALEDDGFAVDELWVSDTSPFMAILSDWPGRDLAAQLNQADGSNGRRWVLDSEHGPEAEFGASPADAPTLLGIVHDFAVPDGDLRDGAIRACAVLHDLAAGHPGAAVILRIYGRTPEACIRVASEAGRLFRTMYGRVDLASRLRTVSGARAQAGGVPSRAVEHLLAALQSSLAGQGVRIPWAPSGLSTRRCGAETAVAAVREFNAGFAPLPGRLTEEEFLRHCRTSGRQLWRPLLMAYAEHRATDGWFAALTVASEWVEDLETYLRAARMSPNGPLFRPSEAVTRATAVVVDRLLLGLRQLGEFDLCNDWNPYASEALRECLARSSHLPDAATARMLHHRAPELLPHGALPGLRLAVHDSADIAAVARRGLQVDDVLQQRAAAARDPLTRSYQNHFRAIVRPYGDLI